jgi:transcriptional regulator with XRE-family HTH domain
VVPVPEPPSRRSAFPGLQDLGGRRRELIAALVRARQESDLSQTQIAARMGTTQSAVARLESGQLDARLSTLERYAAALGHTVDWQVRPSESSTRPTAPDREPR